MRCAAILIAALVFAGCPAKRASGYLDPPADGVAVVDPVSGATCAKTPDTPAAVFEMRTYYFCEARSRERFAEAPTRFVSP